MASFRRNALRNISTKKDGVFDHVKGTSQLRVPLANANDPTPSTPTNLTLQNPPGGYEEGSIIYNQANNTPYIRTNDGGAPVWSLLGGGGGGGNESLFQTLAIGNQTGANGVSGSPTNIVMSANTLVTGSEGDLVLSDPGSIFLNSVFGPRLQTNMTNTTGMVPPFNGAWVYGGDGTVGGGDLGGYAGVFGGVAPNVMGSTSGGAFLISGDPGTTGNSGDTVVSAADIQVGNSVGRGGSAALTGSDILETTNTQNAGGATINGGTSFGLGTPGSINMQAGTTNNVGNTNSGGSIQIDAGGTNGTGDGGEINLRAGNIANTTNSNNGGNITVSAGNTDGTGTAGNISITAGNNTFSPMGGNGGGILMIGGQSSTFPGEVDIRGGSGTDVATGGNVVISGGGASGSLGGNVTLRAGIGFMGATGNVFIQNLPTSDPMLSGALWIDTMAGNVLKVSP